MIQQNNKAAAIDAQPLPELTIKAFVLGIILAVVLAASNAYLGLKAGTTVSASIPAAIISMAILRFFRNSNILENNIVQTAASAGEALVAGLIFILPALLVLGYWTNFHYLETILLGIAGGGFGVLFSIPIRRIMLNNPALPFPEGVAIGNVLKAASAEASAGINYLISGGAVGAVIGFAQDGLQILAGSTLKFAEFGSTIFGFGLGFSPAVLAAGYIVGIRVGAGILVGIVIAWLFLLPIDSHLVNVHQLAGTDFFHQIGRTDIRFVGLGAMMLGGLATIVSLLKPLMAGIKDIFARRKQMMVIGHVVERTEKDISFKYALFGFITCVLIVFFVLRHEVIKSMALSSLHTTILVLALVVFVIIAGFIFCALCAYFSGLVGATNNPGSALTLASIILCSFVAIIMMGSALGVSKIVPAALVILTCSIISTGTAISADNMQDLKAGQLVGATPWKQQLMMFLGAFVSALVIPGILRLLYNAYGMAGVFPHPGMDPAASLSSPQSVMMSVVVKAVFANNLPWHLLVIGFFISVLCMVVNQLFLKPRNLNLMVMAVGIGIYIPLDATVPIVLGSFLSYFVHRKTLTYKATESISGEQNGLMLACGMVAGAALMGVILAIPFAISQSTSVLAIAPKGFTPISVALSLIVTVLLLRWFYRVGTKI